MPHWVLLNTIKLEQGEWTIFSISAIRHNTKRHTHSFPSASREHHYLRNRQRHASRGRNIQKPPQDCESVKPQSPSFRLSNCGIDKQREPHMKKRKCTQKKHPQVATSLCRRRRLLSVKYCKYDWSIQYTNDLFVPKAQETAKRKKCNDPCAGKVRDRSD